MTKAKVTASALNIREPFSKGKVIKSVPKGAIVEQADYGWYEVRLSDGTVGWAWSQYLEQVEDAEAEPPWLDIARGELGVKEVAGPGDNPRIVEYLKSTSLGYPDNANDETPWCSAFVNWCVEQAGYRGTGSAWARSWLQWGKPTDDPQPGDIVVFTRGSNAGHVAFYLDDGDDSVQVLGGNQSDAVTIAWYPKGKVLGYRTID